jgi:septal ring factor EnvC (AmiA/AmiB activator)
MTHFTPRGQVIEELRAKLRDAENQIDDMDRQHRRFIHELAELRRDLEHRDELIVKLYDMIRNEDLGVGEKLAIIKCVIDNETDQDQDLTDIIIVKLFRRGLFR